MSDRCPVWGEEAEELKFGDRNSQSFDSPRAGGKYVITRHAKSLLRQTHEGDHRFKARLTTWLVNQRAFGDEYPKITNATLKELEDGINFPVHERADRLLRALSDRSGGVGHRVLTNSDGFQLALLAHSESVGSTELDFLLDYLNEKG